MSLKSLFGGFVAVVASTVALSGAVFAQSSVSVHVSLGNPSGATTSTSNSSNYLMVKPQYVLSYSRTAGKPNWVAWQLSSTWLGSAARQDTFRADTSLPSGWYQVTNTDYTGSGYDRGHNCPSADRTSSVTNNSATFLMTNMMPQAPDNNQGPWARLEDYTRSLVNSTTEAYIYVASTGTKGTIANGKVTIPVTTYKIVVLVPKGSGSVASRVTTSSRVIAIKMPNSQGIRNNDWRSYRVTVDQIESETGYNFLSEVSTSIQNVIEAKKDTL